MLERAAADNKVAMETADQSLSKREDFASNLQSDIRDLEGRKPNAEMVPETPSKESENHIILSTPLAKFRQSVSSLDFSYTKKSTNSGRIGGSGSSGVYSVGKGDNKGRDGRSYHLDSSGVVADLEDSDDTDSEISFKKNEEQFKMYATEKSHLRLKPVLPADHLSVDYSGSDTSDIAASPVISKQSTRKNSTGFNFMDAASQSKNNSHFQFYKPLNDSRVLQVVLTPLKNTVVVKHTKSSFLRLKNSPIKDPTRGRECMRKTSMPLRSVKPCEKENKRKCEAEDEGDVKSDLNTSKRRKVELTKKVNRTKPVPVNRTGQKYNLRTRR